MPAHKCLKLTKLVISEHCHGSHQGYCHHCDKETSHNPEINADKYNK